MKRLQVRNPLVLLTLLALPAFAQVPISTPAPQNTAPPAQPGHEVTADGRHTLNLKDADIQALIATVSEITGKNFIVGPNVQGKVTVVSAKPMRPDEIYDVFLSVLRVHGFAAVPSGKHDQDRARGRRAAGWLDRQRRRPRAQRRRARHADRSGQARRRRGARADPASADAAGRRS